MRVIDYMVRCPKFKRRQLFPQMVGGAHYSNLPCTQKIICNRVISRNSQQSLEILPHRSEEHSAGSEPYTQAVASASSGGSYLARGQPLLLVFPEPGVSRSVPRDGRGNEQVLLPGKGPSQFLYLDLLISFLL